MLVEIIKETETELIVKDTETNREFPMPIGQFDFFKRMIGTTFETDGESVPYEISRARREDIRAYRREEAMCGNI